MQSPPDRKESLGLSKSTIAAGVRRKAFLSIMCRLFLREGSLSLPEVPIARWPRFLSGLRITFVSLTRSCVCHGLLKIVVFD